MMLAWLKGNLLLVKVGLVLAALLAAYLNGRMSGADSVKRDWDRDKLARMEAQKTAIDKALYQVAAEHRKQLDINKAVIKGYQNDLKVSDERIARERAINDTFRMRFKAADRVPGPAAGEQAASTSGADAAAPEYVELPVSIAGGLRDLVYSADSEVNICVTRLTRLQQWVRDNGFYEQDGGTIPVPTNTQE